MGQQQQDSFIKVTQRWVSGLAGAGSFLASGPHGAPKALHISFILLLLRITKIWQYNSISLTFLISVARALFPFFFSFEL